MKEDDFLYFAEELQQITPRIIPSSFGDIFSLTAGVPGQPLILVVHGSGPKNSADQYNYLLHQYLVRVSYLEKFYIVAIDCPGYGRSKGSKEAVKTFPLQMFRQILGNLNYKTYFAMLGHSQGGAAIFNAVHEDPSITEFLVMDRPVCGNIQRFRGFLMPTLLIYDIQDDGHPIWQGKLLYKQLKNAQFYTYRNSQNPYWVPDNIWDKMLTFFTRVHRKERNKFVLDVQQQRKNKSYSKPKSRSKESRPKKKNISLDKIISIKKAQQKELKLQQIQQIERSQLMSISSKDQILSLEEKPDFKPFNHSQRSSEEEPGNQLVQLKQQQHVQQKISKIEQISIQKDQIKPQNISNHLLKNNLDQLKQEHRCVICYETLFRPVSTNCNHIFCHKCLLQSLLISQKCPLCRGIITKKTERKQLQEKLLSQLSLNQIKRRQNDFKKVDLMMKSIVYIQIGNTSRILETKKSAFTKTKTKYVWELFVKQNNRFPIQQVGFNINMGEQSAKPVRVRNAPFTFESRGTFSFACEIIIKPKNKDYAETKSIYRIDLQPGYHSKKIALRKKCFEKK